MAELNAEQRRLCLEAAFPGDPTFGGLSPTEQEQLLSILIEGDPQEDVAIALRPHIVLVHDLETAEIFSVGPFANQLVALTAMETMQRYETPLMNPAPDHGPLEYLVVELCQPPALGLLGDGTVNSRLKTQL